MSKMKKAMDKAARHKAELERVAAKNKARRKKAKVAKNEKFIKRVARKLRELYYGEKTYLPKKKRTNKDKVTERLKQAGLSKEEIARLRR
jgi:hypothetical protein